MKREQGIILLIMLRGACCGLETKQGLRAVWLLITLCGECCGDEEGAGYYPAYSAARGLLGVVKEAGCARRSAVYYRAYYAACAAACLLAVAVVASRALAVAVYEVKAVGRGVWVPPLRLTRGSSTVRRGVEELASGSVGA
jgi:hypothetical protein